MTQQRAWSLQRACKEGAKRRAEKVLHHVTLLEAQHTGAYVSYFGICKQAVALQKRLSLVCQQGIQASMKVGASPSCSGSLRSERVPIVSSGRLSNVGASQMVFAGPAASIHYRSGRVGRTGQRHANALQKAMSSSAAGRKRGLVVVSCPFPCFSVFRA